MSYYVFYYLDAQQRIVSAASIPFAAPAEAVRHANIELDQHPGIEVWAEGVQVCLAQRSPRPSCSAER